jgi:ABC-type multidrug transport system ATPase subunit
VVAAEPKKPTCHRFIEQLPQGYDTVLRERGTNLSGGQKQLLAFARAAIREPGILVLDEATANLDVGTEALIQEALDNLLEDRTAIIIAHRLSTIRNVDRILVLKQGELVEQGSHETLLAFSDIGQARLPRYFDAKLQRHLIHIGPCHLAKSIKGIAGVAANHPLHRLELFGHLVVDALRHQRLLLRGLRGGCGQVR